MTKAEYDLFQDKLSSMIKSGTKERKRFTCKEWEVYKDAILSAKSAIHEVYTWQIKKGE